MSNPITQLSGRSDLNRPVSRITPRTVQGTAPIAPVSDLPPVATVPQASFDPGSMDTLDAAFPSLEVITRRILQGMQDAMDRAIEEAAREAIDTQRRQSAADAARDREAKLDDLLTELSQEPTLGSEPQSPSTTAAPAANVVGSAPGDVPDANIVGETSGSATTDSVETSTAIESNGRLLGVGGGGDKPRSIGREAAAAVLGEVVKSVREAPRKDAVQIHSSENLAYSAVLLNA